MRAPSRRIPRVRPAAALVACALLPLACDGGDRRAVAWGGTVDTLPGGAIVVANPEAGVWDSAAAWRLVEEVRIGAMDGDGPDVFSDVRDLAVDAGGRIYVLQSTVKRVTVFDRDGRFVRSFGGAGGGPGEFENPIGMQFDPAGRLWVSDPQNARYTVFDTTGAVVASHPRRLSRWGFRWDGRFLDDGSLVEVDAYRAEGAVSGSAYVRFDSTLAPTDTLLPALPSPAADPDEGVFIFRRGTATSYVQIPFRPGGASLLDGGGRQWSASSADYRLVQRTLAGDTVRIVTKAYTPVPVTEADLAAVRERLGEFSSAEGWDESRIPKTKPAFEMITLAEDGHLWVRLHGPHDEGATVFDVFDPEGRYLGAVRAPRELGVYTPLLIAPDVVYGVVRDELDVPQVVRWRIER